MLLMVGAPLSLAGCSGSADGGPPGGPGAGGPVEVGYVVAQPTSVALPTELSGRVEATAVAEVRPQVSGVIERRAFAEGGYVRAGQTLYQIDPSIYRAAANEARAQVGSATATQQAAQIREDRFRPLAEIEAISKQEYTDAVAARRQAAAQSQVARAQLESAQVNLRFTRVPAPISGRIGRSLVTRGALVTANQTEPLAIIQQLDPVFVNLQQSSAELLALRRSLMQGTGEAPASASVKITLEDGSEYGPTGQLNFSETVVDESTGAVTLRVTVPNPAGLLLPGMFVRASLVQEVDTQAFLVPQQAVTRDPKGNATVLIVGAGNKAELRQVQADRTLGENWVVTAGLKQGDRIITQGTGKARPGAALKPVPANAPQKVAAPQARGSTGGSGAGAPQR